MGIFTERFGNIYGKIWASFTERFANDILTAGRNRMHKNVNALDIYETLLSAYLSKQVTYMYVAHNIPRARVQRSANLQTVMLFYFSVPTGFDDKHLHYLSPVYGLPVP